jgi:uncharacterized protein YbaR (Trm112 family)
MRKFTQTATHVLACPEKRHFLYVVDSQYAGDHMGNSMHYPGIEHSTFGVTDGDDAPFRSLGFYRFDLNIPRILKYFKLSNICFLLKFHKF